MTTGSGDQEEMLLYNRKVKIAVLDVLFGQCDTFYIHCMPNPSLFIGNRGLIDREKTEGIILVFGPYSTRHLSWDEKFIHCEMQFSRWERIDIPFECIARMFDKTGQFIMQWSTLTASSGQPDSPIEIGPAETETDATLLEKTEKTPKKGAPSRVIEVDFKNRKGKTEV